MSQEQINDLWAFVNDLAARTEDGISSGQVREVVADEFRRMRLVTRGNIRGIAAWPELHLDTKLEFEDDGDTRSSSGYNGPFKLIAGGGVWRVSSDLSTVTNGTNGTLVDISGAGFDTNYAYSGTRYIVLEGDVDASYVITDWTLSAVSSLDDTKEVEFDAGPPVTQNKIRLYIGRVSDSAPTIQACRTAQRITFGLTNGTAVKVFDSSPVHPEEP